MSFHLNYNMQLNNSIIQPLKLVAEKKCYYFWWSTWLLNNRGIEDQATYVTKPSTLTLLDKQFLISMRKYFTFPQILLMLGILNWYDLRIDFVVKT